MPSAMNPHDRITSSTPWLRSHSSMNVMNGRLTSGTTGLGIVDVSGRSRVPSPPTRMSACTERLPADALVDEPGVARDRRIDEVAAVDQNLAGHPAGDLTPLEVAELRPLGHEHDRIDAV